MMLEILHFSFKTYILQPENCSYLHFFSTVPLGLVKSGEEGGLAQQLNVHENRENRALVTLMKPLINVGGSKEFYHEYYK
jgi:hypothetical protein